jgi:hypothetical protein
MLSSTAIAPGLSRDGGFHSFEFWTSTYRFYPHNQGGAVAFDTGMIPKHSCLMFHLVSAFSYVDMCVVAKQLLLMILQKYRSTPVYIGSDIHFGLKEIKLWDIVQGWLWLWL